MNCRKCGVELPEKSKYCNFCGVKQELSRSKRKRGNGQGTAVKRGQTWTAIWTEELAPDSRTRSIRQVRRWKGGFSSKTAALAYAAVPPPPEDPTEPEYAPTLADYYESWHSSDFQDLSKSKKCAFRIAWRKLGELHNRPMASLTIKDLQSCVDDQTNTYYPAKDMRTLLSHVFKRAVAEGQARTNLAEFIRIPPLTEKEQQPFNEGEIDKLWAAQAAGDRMSGIILLMIYTGMMPGELRQCKIDMIDTSKREIHGCGLKTKKRKNTPIVYPEAVSDMVEDLISTTRSREGYLLGMNTDRFYDEYHAALNRAGVRDLPPYSCRHTTATALALSKTAPSVIQNVMRHTKFSTTQRYIHPDLADAHAAVDSLGANYTANYSK